MSRLMLSTVLAVTAGLACSQAAEHEAGTTEDDMVAVARLMVTLDRVAGEGDLEGFLEVVPDDAVYMPPNEPAIGGKRAIAEWYRALYGQFQIDITHEPLEVDVFSNIIIHRGNARGTMTPKSGGDPIAFDNKYLMVLEKRPDGSLLVWRAVFNSNQ
ncbi:MAG: nuclear transport factor 2 family protein [Gemmatimonadota bacterium]|nr:MAG: nuclear transport factor 2 family protein [Gemmatimonadota bacterium]